MKKLICILAVLLYTLVESVTIIAAPVEIFNEDFENYKVGNFLPQCKEAIVYNQNEKGNFAFAVNNGSMNSKSLAIAKTNGGSLDGGIWLPLNAPIGMSDNDGLLTVKFTMRPRSNFSGFMLGNGTDSGRALYGFRYGDNFHIKSGDNELMVMGISDQETKFEFIIKYPSRRLLGFSVNGETKILESFTVDDYNITYFGAALLCKGYSADSNPYYVYVDDIQVIYESSTVDKKWSDNFIISNQDIGPEGQIVLLPEDEITYSTIWAEGENREVVINGIHDDPPVSISCLILDCKNDGEEGTVQWNYLDNESIPLDTDYTLRYTIKSGGSILSEGSTCVHILPEPVCVMLLALCLWFSIKKVRLLNL